MSGQTIAGVPSLDVRQAWFELQMIEARGQWAKHWQERWENGDDVPDAYHFVSLWIAERCEYTTAMGCTHNAADDCDCANYTKAPTDALAVMGAWASVLDAEGNERSAQFADARAAVAELIEAVQERRQLSAIHGKSTGPYAVSDARIDEALVRVGAA